MEITQTEQKKRIKRNEGSLRDLWNNVTCTNIHIIGVLEGEEREEGTDNIFEDKIAENFLNLGKTTDIQVQEAQSCKQDEPKESHTKTHCN